MCGINGIILKNASDELMDKMIRMNELIIHRGPDDSGVYITSNLLAMGMRRLSIIDLSGGHQPMFNNDKSLVIVFNGEIYNFRELRKKLEDVGVVFTTSSDTEVVLRMYEQYGVAAFTELNGMFALAIHDIKKEQLILARDRFGEKPLYYYSDSETFVWASEMKSLLRVMKKKQTIDPDAMQIFFSLTYIPAPYTIYKGIRKLTAGNYMLVDTKKHTYHIHAYWNISLFPAQDMITDYAFAKKTLRELLTDSVQKRMIADVPIGVFLSGGVDSSIVAALMSEQTNQKIQTFSIGYRNKRYDESKRAAQVACHIRSEHHAYVLDHKDILHEIDSIILNYDEPFADSSCLPAWYVSKKTAAHVKVALTGDGGDEVFGGYNKYLLQTYGKIYRQWVPEMVHRKFIQPLMQSAIWHQKDSHSFAAKINKFLRASGNNRLSNHINILMLGFRDSELSELFRNPVLRTTENLLTNYLDQDASHTDDLKLARYLDQHISLEGDMLAKVDRASMLCSLECRAPFLDHRLMEFSHRIPDHFLIQGNNKKRILKETFADMLPAGLFQAPKSGFEVPVADWFRNELASDLKETLNEKNLAKHGLFNEARVDTLIHEHIQQKRNHAYQLWTLYCFQKWYHQHADE